MSTTSIILYLLLSGAGAAAAPLVKRKGGGGRAGGSIAAASVGASASTSANSSSGSTSDVQLRIVKIFFGVIGLAISVIAAAYIGHKLFVKYARKPGTTPKLRRPSARKQRYHNIPETTHTNGSPSHIRDWIYVARVEQGKFGIQVPAKAYKK